jgi:Glycosyl hydrolase family 12
MMTQANSERPEKISSMQKPPSLRNAIRTAAIIAASATLAFVSTNASAVTSYSITPGGFGENIGLEITGNPAFRVTSASYQGTIQNVKAYPNASLQGAFPRQIASLINPQASFTWAPNGAPGGWNASIETWINQSPTITGHPDGAEIMIWLARQNIYAGDVNAPKVYIDGAWWYFRTWRASVNVSGRAIYWNYVHFLRVTPTTSASLKIAPFYSYVESKNLLKPWWYLEFMQAGFELYSGGQGLAETAFNAAPSWAKNPTGAKLSGYRSANWVWLHAYVNRYNTWLNQGYGGWQAAGSRRVNFYYYYNGSYHYTGYRWTGANGWTNGIWIYAPGGRDFKTYVTSTSNMWDTWSAAVWK